MGYSEWRNFLNVVTKAKAAENHFADVRKMVGVKKEERRLTSAGKNAIENPDALEECHCSFLVIWLPQASKISIRAEYS